MAGVQGQTCVVTGGARGIGRAIVDLFRNEGAVVHSLDVDDPADFADDPQAPEASGHAHFHTCDITDLDAVEAIFSRLREEAGQVDVLVNNAATVTRAVPITVLSPQEWQRTFAVNVTGVFNVTRSALSLMGRGGRIVNLASTFAHVGSPGRVAYSTTKGAVLAFTRSLALDVAAQGIRVNSVSPGGIATDRLIELFGSEQAAEEYLVPLHPIGHTGKPVDIAHAVLFLVSGHARFVTGADLRVDGGYTAQ